MTGRNRIPGYQSAARKPANGLAISGFFPTVDRHSQPALGMWILSWRVERPAHSPEIPDKPAQENRAQQSQQLSRHFKHTWLSQTTPLNGIPICPLVGQPVTTMRDPMQAVNNNVMPSLPDRADTPGHNRKAATRLRSATA